MYAVRKKNFKYTAQMLLNIKYIFSGDSEECKAG